VPQLLVYLYHPHHLYHFYHLYHRDFFELLHHDLHHNLISTLGKGQNNAHEDGQPNHSYHIEPVPTEIY
jgi:hypothetical protein